MRNYGLIIRERKPSDYVLGASPLPFEILQPNGDWHEYLPEKEVQNIQGFETYACVIFTTLNCIETLIKRKYGIDTNWSERFLAAIVNTSNGGSVPQDVFDYLRKVGIVPEASYPFNVFTSEEYFKYPDPKLFEVARQFLAEWDFKYEAVPSNAVSISKALQSSPLLVSVPAWYERDGIYYRPNGMTDNHATTLIYEREGEYRQVFDSYESPVVKDIAWEVIPMIAYRFSITKRSTIKPTLWQRIINWFKKQKQLALSLDVEK